MPKNSKRMGLFPRGYGLTLNDRSVFSPSRFAEGAVLILPENKIKEMIKEYSEYSYDEFRKGIKRVHGSYNLFRDGLKSASVVGTVSIGVIKSRRDGRKKGSNSFRNPTVYNTAVKGIQTLDDKINHLFFSCGCEDYTIGEISDESRDFSIACAHIAALIQAYQWKDEINLEGKVRYYKPLKEGGIQSPYDFRNREDLLVKYLEMRYMEKKKLFEIDRYLIKKDIITKPFKEGIKEGIVTFNCIKDCENYDMETKYFMNFYSKVLSSIGERTGIALEDNRCVWNYKINDKLDIRLIPGYGEVSIMRIVYDKEFISKVKNSNDEFIEEYWHLPVSIDNMRRKERVYAIDKNLNKKELINLISN